MSAELYRFSITHTSEISFHKDSWFIYWKKKCSSCNFFACHIRYTRYLFSYWSVYWSISHTPRLSAVCPDLRLWAGNSILNPLEPSLLHSQQMSEDFLYQGHILYILSTACILCYELSPHRANHLKSHHQSDALTWVFSVANKVNLFSYKKASTFSVSWATVQQKL